MLSEKIINNEIFIKKRDVRKRGERKLYYMYIIQSIYR